MEGWPGEPREHRLGEVLQWKLKLNLISPGEDREYHLGEVLQGRSKSKFNIILSYSIVLFLLVQVFIIQTI